MKKRTLVYCFPILFFGVCIATKQVDAQLPISLPTQIPALPTGISVPAVIPSPLQGIKLQLCQTLSPEIITNFKSLLQSATDMNTQLTTIATQAENFYESNKAITHTNVPNYDTLAVKVKTDEITTTKLLQNVQQDIDSFSCASNDPIGDTIQFKNDMQQLIQELIIYQQDVENLLTAIQSNFPSTTPSTTVTP